MSKVRVLIVDDHPALRVGTRALLERQQSIEVVEAIGEGKRVLELVERLRPQVVLLDVRLPDLNGVEVARQLRRDHPDVGIVILTGYDDMVYRRALRRLGVHAYLRKTATALELERAVWMASRGEMVEEDAADGKLPLGLSERERQVLEAMAMGLRNQEIAERLSLALKTVEWHVGNVLSKLEARSRTEAIGRALAEGLVSLPPSSAPEEERLVAEWWERDATGSQPTWPEWMGPPLGSGDDEEG